MNEMSHIILMTSSSFFLLTQVLAEFELTKVTEKDSNDCVVIHLELNLTLRECKFAFSSIKSNVLLMSSSIYSHHLQSHFSCSNRHSISCLTAVKLSFLITHFCAIFSLKFVISRVDVLFIEFDSISLHDRIFADDFNF